MKPNYSIRVLERAAEVLNCFTLSHPEKSLTELAQETGLHKSTVFRILETLEYLGWVANDARSGYYRLGFGIFELGSRAVSGLDFYQASHSHLEELVRITGQSAHLVTYDNGEVLYLNKLQDTSSFISQPSNIGLRLPMHCTGVGKVLLAYMDPKDAMAVLEAKGLCKKTDKTITDKEKMLSELEEIRKQGYAIDNEEIQTGLCCVAAPLCDYTGRVMAAISVSGLTSNFNNERLPGYIDMVVRTALKISKDLGCRKIIPST